MSVTVFRSYSLWNLGVSCSTALFYGFVVFVCPGPLVEMVRNRIKQINYWFWPISLSLKMYGKLNEDKQVIEDKYRLYQETSNLCCLTCLISQNVRQGTFLP